MVDTAGFVVPGKKLLVPPTLKCTLRYAMAVTLSIGIIVVLAVPMVVYLGYIVVRARKGAVPKRWTPAH